MAKTESEELFEEYLHSQGLTDFAFEEEFAETSRRPDYTLAWKGRKLLFDVKEFRATAEDARLGFGAFDPYPPLREKIEAGRKKFKDLEQYCCSLVLYNVDKPLVFLDWQHVYGAMLGNLGFSVPLALNRQEPVPVKNGVRMVFTTGGKMLRYRDGQPVAPQNQTLSAVVVLEHLMLGDRRFRAYCNERERELRRGLTAEEFWNLIKVAKGTERDVSLRELRVVIHENPYARIPLPRDVFCGPYDERYGGVDGGIGRISAGHGVLDLPQDE